MTESLTRCSLVYPFFRYFAPLSADNVGVFDPTTATFSTITTAASGVTAGDKYAGAALGDDGAM